MELNLEEARENYIAFENGDIFDIKKENLCIGLLYHLDI